VEGLGPPISSECHAADYTERVLSFDCRGASLWGILARPRSGTVHERAVLIAVGGPQYRVGSHRQFVLLARRLAAAGHAVLRFDYRGQGDSEGDMRSFAAVDDDLKAAIDALLIQCPAVRQVAIWGLCDAASAALIYCAADPRVTGLALLNPWARSEKSLAATHLRHWYLTRIFKRDFWQRLVGGEINLAASLRALIGDVRAVRTQAADGGSGPRDAPFQVRMADGLRRFKGSTLLLLSGNDLTAREFIEYTRAAPEWTGLLERADVNRVDIPQADHTFSNAIARREIEDRTLAWLRSF
jgi:exosortase A-associated hydrolase 1